MNFRQMEMLIAVAEKGSFSRAAESLFITPSALMQQLKQLEEEVGAPLLRRNSKGSTLTEIGEGLYARFSCILAEADGAMRRAKQQAAEAGQTIRLGIPPVALSKFCMEACDEFKSSFPESRIAFVPVAFPEVMQKIADGEIDLCDTPYSDEIADTQLEFTALFEDLFCCLVAQRDPLSAEKNIRLSQLRGRTLTSFNFRMCAELVRYIQEREPSIRLLHDREGDAQIPASIFKACLEGSVYLVTKNIADSYAPLLGIPLQIPLRKAYGFLHGRDPSPIAKSFIAHAREKALREAWGKD